ncbi:hypothetical protein ACJX0J_033028, partial [Zea mays]
MLHTPLTTSLFLGLNQLDYTLNVFNGGKITYISLYNLIAVGAVNINRYFNLGNLNIILSIYLDALNGGHFIDILDRLMQIIPKRKKCVGNLINYLIHSFFYVFTFKWGICLKKMNIQCMLQLSNNDTFTEVTRICYLIIFIDFVLFFWTYGF